MDSDEQFDDALFGAMLDNDDAYQAADTAYRRFWQSEAGQEMKHHFLETGGLADFPDRMALLMKEAHEANRMREFDRVAMEYFAVQDAR